MNEPLNKEQPHSRTAELHVAESDRIQARLNEISRDPFFSRMHVWDEDEKSYRLGSNYAGRTLDGVEHNNLPWSL